MLSIRIRGPLYKASRPDFGGSSGGGGKNLGEVQQSSSRTPWNVKANFHSGKLSVDWNGQENFSLLC
jgi:hypothetical protein